MASAADDDHPSIPRHTAVFDGEDLLDDDDDQISDHEDDDSASSAAALALDRPPPSSSTASMVTIAVHGVPDLHLNQHQQQQDLFLPESKKPADESRKLFQRLWTDEDEIELLQGFLDYTTQRCGPYGSSQHHDTTAFYDQIRSKFQLDFNKNQLVEKLRRLKKKYRNQVNRFSSGKDYAFKSPHDQTTFEISSKIWGNNVISNANGSTPTPFRSTAVEEDDDDLNNPTLISCQSPITSGIDVNSKVPRPRKRNRSSTAIKLEEKTPHPQHMNYTPIAAAPVLGLGISGPMSTVIEETIKSCLSPILKELFTSSTSSYLYPNGLCCGHGFGPRSSSPLSLCFPGCVTGDKTGDDRWRKQQILELEVFSKRLELVQSQIRDQLQELRSMGN